MGRRSAGACLGLNALSARSALRDDQAARAPTIRSMVWQNKIWPRIQAIDRATRWVYTEIRANKTAVTARRFLKALHARCPVKSRFVLTDHGKEFTDRLLGARKHAESGAHEFHAACEALGIEYGLTPPKSPQTNGMAERFNGRVSQVLNTHRLESAEDLARTLARYVWLYNHHLPQKALNQETPIQALKRWQSTPPRNSSSSKCRIVRAPTSRE
jgi:transposase InsO family protein